MILVKLTIKKKKNYLIIIYNPQKINKIHFKRKLKMNLCNQI